jgi:AcrR family transcriptional regulator
MSFDRSQDGRPQDGRIRNSYHHGNLRQTLIETALRMIAERGPAGFSFAELARAAGVSPAAPYRHFSDRNALLGEVARRGYEQFTETLQRAWNSGRPDPLRAFEACGRAYLQFARAEPAAYAVMFESSLSTEADPALRLASERAFGVLRNAADAVCAATLGPNRPPALMVALHVWAMAHGIASLFVGHGEQARRRLPMSPEELLEAGVLVYLQSLGVSHNPSSGSA